MLIKHIPELKEKKFILKLNKCYDDYSFKYFNILKLNKSLFLDLHIQINLPLLLFLAKKVVMEGTSLGFFLLAIVYTADPSVV